MMIMFLSVMFMSSIQPLMMVVSLILITLFYSMYLYKMMMSFWFSYAMIMVMLSGVFIVFTYMASLVPNEEFETYSFIFFIIFLFLMFVKVMEWMGEMSFEFICLSLWGFYVGLFVLFLVIMLLSIMMMVVWVSCKDVGALRVM